VKSSRRQPFAQVERVAPNALSSAGFTLVELMVSLTLAMAIMAAIISSYLFLGRNLGRIVNQQTVETEGRRALATFTQDVRSASAISGTPTVSSVTLTIPSGASTTTVAYAFDSSTGTLTRTPASGTARTLVSNLTSLYFRYYNDTGTAYDSGSAPYTTQTAYMSGLKQISLTFTAQTGSANNGTRTNVHSFASPRLLVRNRPLLN
jgi:Tfp pilus assembly protein PilW